jgi:arginase
MPLAFLLGIVENVNSFPGFEYFKPCLKPSDIVYIGLRDVDDGEKKIIKELGIKAFTVRYLSAQSAE